MIEEEYNVNIIGFKFPIQIEENESGLYFATSPNIKYLLVAASTIAEVKQGVIPAIKSLMSVISESTQNDK